LLTQQKLKLIQEEKCFYLVDFKSTQ